MEQLLQSTTGFETLMRVRYSTGLKMNGIFGSYRVTKIIDQIELLTCPSSRKLMFEFVIEGKIASEFIIIQFSSLYTDLEGNRYFSI